MSISATRPSLGSEQNRDSDIRFPKLRRGNGEHCEDVWHEEMSFGRMDLEGKQAIRLKDSTERYLLARCSINRFTSQSLIPNEFVHQNATDGDSVVYRAIAIWSRLRGVLQSLVPYAEDVLIARKICKINTKKKITYGSIVAVIFISSAIALQYAGQTENIETS
ncbi:hypothetical protein TIFTF001_018429 [Ficus carica]|uniref:Uncharacterized protein n=1 Tax=Ficus carica TaxID=3494 RepID=A0AA88D7Y6_FICCA|nr:hypothetical protein TIFTF001_018429 [Ficus carica]